MALCERAVDWERLSEPERAERLKSAHDDEENFAMAMRVAERSYQAGHSEGYGACEPDWPKAQRISGPM